MHDAAADGGQGALAWDMIGDWGELARLGRIWTSWGGLYGGEQDPIHFEWTARLGLAMLAYGPDGNPWNRGRLRPGGEVP